ncbi:GNAT family N-acetyltransferase [Stappia sp. ES.058]|uniref:GNAT family N-acetyltransferase n=1 Tax=Stappia sp. ES.058 TaxID=1881061 RepID=UPI00087C22F3|nr:N-acetyltransferase [Stappia sp. ES.058]SDU30017.1 Predicted N-acetyltransferase YhbS [Stappia sp. ES.058]
MLASSWLIRTETSDDLPEIEALQAEAFGPGRFARTAFRLREGVPHDPRLSFVGLSGDALAGSVWLTPITIGREPSLLLGPLTVAPAFKNRGLGRLLVAHVIKTAQALGESSVLLVGDAPYYGPLGFAPVPPGSIALPGPADPSRVLLANLRPDTAFPTGPVRGGRARVV